MKINKKRGFTLTELIVALGIVAVAGVFIVPNFFGAYNEKALANSADELLGYLREAHQKSVAQENSCAWAVNVVSPASGNGYYEVVCVDTGVVQKTIALPAKLKFVDPPRGSNKQIVFNKLTGTVPAEDVITVSLVNNEDVYKTIRIEATGLMFLGVAASGVEEVVKTIKESGGDYFALAQWAGDYGGIDFGSCPRGDLVCANKIAVAKIDGAWSYADCCSTDIFGPNSGMGDPWITDAEHYIKIYTTASARSNGKYDETKYRTGYPIHVDADYVYIDGLQINTTGTEGAIHSSDWAPGQENELVLSNCIVNGLPNGAGITISSGRNAKIFNNIVYNTIEHGIKALSGAGDVVAYNNTVYKVRTFNGLNYGIKNEGSTGLFLLKNNISSNNVKDYYGTVSAGSVNNISKDGTSPNSAFRYNTVAFVSTIEGREDFHLLGSDTKAIDKGIDLSADAYLAFAVDIDGQTRSGLWDIGADQY